MSGVGKDAALIKQLAEFAGVTVTEVARRAKVDPETLRKPSKGLTENRLSQRTIEKLQAAFPAFPGWNRTSDSHLPFKGEETVSDTLSIPMLEIAYGMGGTFLDGVDPGVSHEQFPRAFVRMFTSAPEGKLCFAHGIGDSMYPTIGDRDLLLIDRSYDSIRINDQIWAVAANGIGMVKRVRVESDGQVNLLSDNDRVPSYAAAEDELTIIGRVVAVVRRI